MKNILRITCVLFIAFILSPDIYAQFDLNKICRVEDGRVVFKLNLNWDDKQKKDISYLFNLDSILIAKAYQEINEIDLQGVKWKVKKLKTNQIELSVSLNSIDKGNDTIKSSVGNKNRDFAKFTNQDYVFLVNDNWLNGSDNSNQETVEFGVNSFSKTNIFHYKNGIASFYLPGYKNSKKVFLAGSFNNWNVSATSMQNNDSGWVVCIKLFPGKHFYKYLVDGKWILDPFNKHKQNDGFGNINSYVFCYNYIFKLSERSQAHNVFLAGSFNNWNSKELRMNKVAEGWDLPLYLKEGTHTYKFIVDGQWILDPNNQRVLNDGNGNDNSEIGIGDANLFQLKGFESAKEVYLSGSFNNWIPHELRMEKKSGQWQLSYVLASGNYEYKFNVEGKWITDPDNLFVTGSGKTTNSVLAFHPNYTFTLNHFANARQVFITGNFNQWRTDGYRMIKKDDKWVFPIYLFSGKIIYKFIVDNKWILDPDNKTWEENEYGTGNSVLWIQK